MPGTTISLLPVGTATEPAGVAGASAPILQLRGGPVLPTAVSALGDARIIVGVDGLIYASQNGAPYAPLSSGSTSPWNNTTTAGFITENVTTENVLIGTIVATLARKLVVVATNAGVDQGIRVESANAGDNVLDYLKTGDAFVRLSITGTTIAIGDGTGAPDVALSRILVPLATLNINVATRFGGDISRHEAPWTIQTTRTLAGVGDNITVRGANAVALLAGTAFTGAASEMLSGDSAAVGVAQADGSSASIAAGSAASGVGGSLAQGGNVFIATGQGALSGVVGAATTISGHVVVMDKGGKGVNVIPLTDQDGSSAFNMGKLGTRDAANGGTDPFNARWWEINAVNVVTGDIVFTDPGCPICGKPFADGDDIVLRVIKAEKFEKGYLTRTVPAHHDCK